MAELLISLVAILISVFSLLVSLRNDKYQSQLNHINRRKDLRLGWMRQIRDVELSKHHLQTALENSSADVVPRLQAVIDRHEEIIEFVRTSLKTADNIDVSGPPDRKTAVLIESEMGQCVIFGEMSRQIREDAEMIIAAVRRDSTKGATPSQL